MPHPFTSHSTGRATLAPNPINPLSANGQQEQPPISPDFVVSFLCRNVGVVVLWTEPISSYSACWCKVRVHSLTYSSGRDVDNHDCVCVYVDPNAVCDILCLFPRCVYTYVQVVSIVLGLCPCWNCGCVSGHVAVFVHHCILLLLSVPLGSPMFMRPIDRPTLLTASRRGGMRSLMRSRPLASSKLLIRCWGEKPRMAVETHRQT